MNPRNCTIDLAKFIAALLVVAIHTSLFSDVNETLYFVFNELICRLAVPFFAICTGYYLCLSINSDQSNKVWKQEWKLIKIYALWTLLYFLFLIPNWIEIGYLSIPNYIGYLKSAVLIGSYFHLWYVLYVIYAIPVFYLCLKYIRPSLWVWIAIVLYSINAFNYGYSSFFPEDSWVQIFSCINKGYAIVKSQFVILPMLLCGAYLTRHTGSLQRNMSFLILSFIALIAEASLLRQYGHIEKVSQIMMILPTACFIFASLINIRIDKPIYKHLGAMSLIIYCVHPMFCRYIIDLAPNTIATYLTVGTLSVLVSFAWVRLLPNRIQR